MDELWDMATQTLLVAVGEEDSGRIEDLAETVRKIADPSGARVVVAHVLSESEYREVAETMNAPQETTFGGFVITTLGEAVRGEQEPPAGGNEATESTQEEATKQAVQEKPVVRALGEALENEGVEYEVHGGVGDPAEEIITLAGDLDADFVMVGGRRQSAARKALFGSVSQEIIRSVDRPVISVPEGAE